MYFIKAESAAIFTTQVCVEGKVIYLVHNFSLTIKKIFSTTALSSHHHYGICRATTTIQNDRWETTTSLKHACLGAFLYIAYNFFGFVDSWWVL